MIELKHDSLRFSFPDVHRDATLSINFQRTLRIADDGQLHFLPPGLGNFPLRHVDDFADRVPANWREHGGVMLPMFQSEALWVRFDAPNNYPFLLKIAAGKVNAVTGETWTDVPNRDPQDYLTVPSQPWLDGFCVQEGEVRQFVAMPLGGGYTAEEQLTGEAEFGGLQIVAYPMKAEKWEEMLRKQPPNLFEGFLSASTCGVLCSIDMGLAPGGRMKQTIYEDHLDMDVWDLRVKSRCFVHIANSLHWRAITGQAPPTLPPTAAQYSDAGLPWFDYYSDTPAVAGSSALAGLKSVKETAAVKGEEALPENESAPVRRVIAIRRGPASAKDDLVRESQI